MAFPKQNLFLICIFAQNLALASAMPRKICLNNKYEWHSFIYFVFTPRTLHSPFCI